MPNLSYIQSGSRRRRTGVWLTRILDVLIIGSGPGGYVTGHSRGATWFQDGDRRSAITSAAFALNWGCIPTKGPAAFCGSLSLSPARKDYGLKADNVAYDPKAVVQRSRAVSKRLNDGVGFLMKKNKVSVIWGEASIDAPGKVSVKASKSEAPKARSAPVNTRQSTSSLRPARDPACCLASNPTRSWCGLTSKPWFPIACQKHCW